VVEAQLKEKEAERVADEERRTARKQRIVIAGLVVIVIAALLSMFGVSLAAGQALKDTAAVGATLASNDGHVMKTSKALVPLPLLAAPVLPREQLEGVDSITVSFLDPASEVEVEVRANMRITAAILYSKVHVKFETASSTVKEVLIKDGEATVTLADGTVADVCESNVQCSALMVDDAAQAGALMEEAIAALEAANITVDMGALMEDAEHGRQLGHTWWTRTFGRKKCRWEGWGGRRKKG
jgi:hypothetical protein